MKKVSQIALLTYADDIILLAKIQEQLKKVKKFDRKCETSRIGNKYRKNGIHGNSKKGTSKYSR